MVEKGIPEQTDSLNDLRTDQSEHRSFRLLQVLSFISKDITELGFWPEVRRGIEHYTPEQMAHGLLLQPEFYPRFLEANPQQVVTVDIETSRTGSGENEMFLAVTIDQNGVVTSWKKEQVTALIAYLDSHQLILTYNGLKYDLPILLRDGKAGPKISLFEKSLDMFELIKTTQSGSFRPVSLWQASMDILGVYQPQIPGASYGRSGAERIPKLVESDDPQIIEMVLQHCYDDVVATRTLYALLQPSSLHLTYYFQQLIEDAGKYVRDICVESFETPKKRGGIKTEEYHYFNKNPAKELFEQLGLTQLTPRRYLEGIYIRDGLDDIVDFE